MRQIKYLLKSPNRIAFAEGAIAGMSWLIVYGWPRIVSGWLWCAIRVMGAERSLGALSGDALRQRHTEPGHPVEHRAADPGFGLLGRQCPGAQAATDDSFVAEHGGLPKRAPAVADRLLPAQAPLVPDRLDVLVPLTGCGARGRARHGG